MSLPSLAVAIAFGVNPMTTPAGGDWVDVTPYVRELAINRGKDHELTNSQAGELTLRLRNTDRRFDPTYTSGAYYPNVLPMRRVRVRATRGSTFDLFQGVIDDWGQAWEGRPINGSGPAECSVHATDMLTLLANHAGLSSLVSAILADEPVAYWPLWENPLTDGLPRGLVGDGALDFTSFTGSRPTTQAGPLSSGQTALKWDFTIPTGTINNTADHDELDVLPKTLELWIKPGGSGTGDYGVFEVVAGSAPSAWAVAWGGDRPELIHYNGTATEDSLLGLATGWSAGVWGHLVITVEKSRVRFYRNGVFANEVVPGIALRKRNSAGGFRMGIEDKFGIEYDGGAAHFAVYDYVLPDERIAEHYAATIDAIGPTDAGTAIGEVLDAVGWPAGERSLDTNGAAVGRIIPEGSALDAVMAYGETADHGLVFVDGAGALHFLSRTTLHALTTSSETYGDSGAEVVYQDLTVAYDDQNLYGKVSATADALNPEVASDSTSLTTYGNRSLEVDCGPLDDANVLADIANGFLAAYKSPTLRVGRAELDGAADDTRLQAILAAAPGRKVTVVRRPPGGGSAISQASYIERIEHRLSRALSQWHTSLGVVPAVPQGWILQDAVYGLLGAYGLGW